LPQFHHWQEPLVRRTISRARARRAPALHGQIRRSQSAGRNPGDGGAQASILRHRAKYRAGRSSRRHSGGSVLSRLAGFVAKSRESRRARNQSIDVGWEKRGLATTQMIPDGQNVAIEYRWADGHYERLPVLAADLAGHRVPVIIAGGPVAAQTAKEATATIPIVFTSGADPVWSGLVASLSRPGANLTGASLIAAEMGAKRLELTRELLPHARAVAMVVNPNYPGADSEMAEVEAAGRIVGLRTEKLTAGSEDEIDAAFASLAQRRADAVMVGTDGFLITRCTQIVALAARYRIPGIYPFVA